jgi:multiple sugar transport system permease protein
LRGRTLRCPPPFFLLGGPDSATKTTSVYIYEQAFSGSYLYNRAAAASMIMFIVIMICTAALFLIMRDPDKTGYGKADAKKVKQQQKLMKKAAKGGI